MRKNYVKKEDYDFYSIVLPLKVAFSRKRKEFIFRELEKLHPKLSAACFIKSWLHFKKGKIQADVAVMEKNLVASYKKRFPSGSVYLPEKRKLILSRRKYPAVFGIFLLLFLGFFSGKMLYETFFSRKKIGAEDVSSILNSDGKSKNADSDLSGLSGLPGLPVLLAPSQLVVSVFCSVSKNGGKISSFSWNHGICSFSISGCSSEDIAQAQYCVVSYKDNKPVFSLAVPVAEKTEIEDIENADEENPLYLQFMESLENASESRELIETLRKMRSTGEIELLSPEDFKRKNENNEKNILDENKDSENKKNDFRSSIKKVRGELFRLGASIHQEHLTEKTAEFEFSVPEDIFYSALKICGIEAKKIGWQETSFSVEKSGSKNTVKVVFSREKENQNIDACFSPLLLTANYAWLFKSENLKLEPKKTALFSASRNLEKKNTEALSPRETMEKLGQIKRNDGFTYVYYKKSDGKILCERLEA